MCNRYRAMGQAALMEYARTLGIEWEFPAPRYNIGPNQIAPIFVMNEDPKPVATVARWNLIPSFEASDRGGPLRTNARAEEVLTKPSYRDAVQRRRCLVPSDGFYEWEHLHGGRVKLPWAFELAERHPFTFAGLWEPGHETRPPSFTILTTRPNELVARIHNRMPVMLADKAARRWLTPGPLTRETLAPFVEPFPAGRLRSYRVNPLLNSVRQDSARRRPRRHPSSWPRQRPVSRARASCSESVSGSPRRPLPGYRRSALEPSRPPHLQERLPELRRRGAPARLHAHAREWPGDLIGPMLAGQLPVTKVLSLTALLVPFTASYALPMGMLTGILLTLGRLSADNEITAMRAAGISMPRLTRPVFVLAALGSALGLYINFEAMPRAKVVYERELTAALHANPLNLIVPRTFIRQFPGYVLYIGDKQAGSLKDFWLWKFDANHHVILFERAASGRVDYDAKTNSILVTLANFQVEKLDERKPEDFTESPAVATAEVSDPVALPLDRIFGRTELRQKLLWMTYAELRSPLGLTQALKDEDGDERRARMKVELTIQEKFTLAFAVLSFALIGVPLGIQVSRRETSANLGLR